MQSRKISSISVVQRAGFMSVFCTIFSKIVGAAIALHFHNAFYFTEFVYRSGPREIFCQNQIPRLRLCRGARCPVKSVSNLITLALFYGAIMLCKVCGRFAHRASFRDNPANGLRYLRVVAGVDQLSDFAQPTTRQVHAVLERRHST